MAKLYVNGAEVARMHKEKREEVSGDVQLTDLTLRANGCILKKTNVRDAVTGRMKFSSSPWRHKAKINNGAVVKRLLAKYEADGYKVERLIHCDDLIFNFRRRRFEPRPAAEVERLIAENKLAAAGGKPERVLRSSVSAPGPSRGPAYLTPTEKEPSNEQMMDWEMDGVWEATDGCRVEPDGKCPHGHVSWGRYLGLV